MSSATRHGEVTFEELRSHLRAALVRSNVEGDDAGEDVERIDDELAALDRVWNHLLEATKGGQMAVDLRTVTRNALGTAHSVLRTVPDGGATRAALVVGALRDGLLREEPVEAILGPPTMALVRAFHEFTQRRLLASGPGVAAMQLLRLERLGGDPRVLVVMLADRLQRMRGYQHQPTRQDVEFARETLTWPAQIAGMAGLYWLKAQLEDVAFRISLPNAYQTVASLVASKLSVREARIRGLRAELESLLREADIPGEVSGRTKHLYSIHKKMQSKDHNFSELFDVEALRIIIDGPKELLWQTQGLLVSRWEHLHERTKNYVENPKANGYRSLHLTLLDDEQNAFEVQLRTRSMHLDAESGLAAHWAYKKGARVDETHRMLAHALRRDEEMLAHALRRDEEESETDELRSTSTLFVRTPQGDEKPLPAGSTALDFAYAIHTSVGHRAQAVRVNGKQVELSHPLSDGDRVEVQTANESLATPDREKLVRTASARQKIRQATYQEGRNERIERGRRELTDALRPLGLGVDDLTAQPTLRRVLAQRGYTELEALVHDVGARRQSAQTVVRWIQPPQRPRRRTASTTAIAAGTGGTSRVVVVVGVDGCLDTAFAQCCDPHPPTPIIGYLGRDQRIMIHASSCGTVNRNGARNLDRLIEVRWQSVDPATDYGTRRIRLCVETTDRERLLAEMTEAISAAYANIARAVARVVDDGKAINYFDILVDVPERADLILHALRDIPGVDRASRME